MHVITSDASKPQTPLLLPNYHSHEPGFALENALINILHAARRGLLERGHIVRGGRGSLGLRVDAQTKRNHAVDTLSKVLRRRKSEARSEQGGFVKQISQILDSLVRLVLGDTRFKLLDDGVRRVELHRLFRGHVRRHGRVAECLSLHDTLHVGRPAELTGNENAGGFGDTVGNDNLFDLVGEVLLDGGAKTLVLGDLPASVSERTWSREMQQRQPFPRPHSLFTRSLLLVSLLELETLFGNTDELFAVKLFELGNGVLVDGVDKEQNLESLLFKNL